MRNFDAITESPAALAAFLYQVQDDALEAEGCSMKLKMPHPEISMTWEMWLDEEVK